MSGPQPPTTIELLFQGAVLQRYIRKGGSNDAEAAVVGRGGFGTAYRYTKDSTFTPNTSQDSPSHDNKIRLGISSDLRSNSGHDGIEATASRLRKAPGVVVVKICRTPCSGSFDELPKTSLTSRKERKQRLLNKSLNHIRVVRGEARILRYLQSAQETSDAVRNANIVRLLANLPLNGKGGKCLTSLGSEEPDSVEDLGVEPDEGPPSRLLVFERLVELDYELVGNAWVKSTSPWSVEKVEMMAQEIIQGLLFLHRHNIAHGDLKPSNLMLDARTACVKIIDLGASRRFVELPNTKKDSTSAIEELDRESIRAGRAIPTLPSNLCEGLGSLTGSPHYMAPEVLLQATRYTDASGRSRNVLEDYEPHQHQCFTQSEQISFRVALNDLRRGWGIKADVWSWACTVQALMLKTIKSSERPSSATVCPFDFSFSKHREKAMEPLHMLPAEEKSLPRFHLWARSFPVLIVEQVIAGVNLHELTQECSPELRFILRCALRHQDSRLTAAQICGMFPKAVEPAAAVRSDSQLGLHQSPTPSDLMGSGHRMMAENEKVSLCGTNHSTPSLVGSELAAASPQVGTNTLFEVPGASGEDSARFVLNSRSDKITLARSLGTTTKEVVSNPSISQPRHQLRMKQKSMSILAAKDQPHAKQMSMSMSLLSSSSQDRGGDKSERDAPSQDSVFAEAFHVELKRMSPLKPLVPLEDGSMYGIEARLKEGKQVNPQDSLLFGGISHIERLSKDSPSESRSSRLGRKKSTARQRPSTCPTAGTTSDSVPVEPPPFLTTPYTGVRKQSSRNKNMFPDRLKKRISTSKLLARTIDSFTSSRRGSFQPSTGGALETPSLAGEDMASVASYDGAKTEPASHSCNEGQSEVPASEHSFLELDSPSAKSAAETKSTLLSWDTIKRQFGGKRSSQDDTLGFYKQTANGSERGSRLGLPLKSSPLAKVASIASEEPSQDSKTRHGMRAQAQGQAVEVPEGAEQVNRPDSRKKTKSIRAKAVNYLRRTLLSVSSG